MLEILEKYLEYTVFIIITLKILASFISWSQRKRMQYLATKWLIPFCGLLMFLAIIEWILGRFIFNKSFIYYISCVKPLLKSLGIQDMNFTASVSYLIKFIFLGLFFRDLMAEKFWKTFFQGAVWVLIVFELVQVFVFKSYQGYDSLSSTVKNVFIIGGVGLFLYKFYHSDTGKISLVKNPYFWISLGLILPAFAEFFLEFIFTKLYQTDLEGFYKYYLVRNASQIIGFLLLIMGIWQAKYLRFLPKEY